MYTKLPVSKETKKALDALLGFFWDELGDSVIFFSSERFTTLIKPAEEGREERRIDLEVSE